MIQLPISIDNCIVRSYRHYDGQSLVKYANNPRVAGMLRDMFPNPYTLANAEAWLYFVEHQPVEAYFAIVMQDECIGGIGLNLQGDVSRMTAEIGFWLGEPFWGQGIATEAVRALLKYGFETINLNRIQANIFESNQATRCVLKKTGFIKEGRLRKSVVKNGQIMDQLIYAILRQDYDENAPPAPCNP
ncbi:GNAT family N-acetyltransferase [bacterium]|nr:GNAT family N-acetyltransferase [bacterium]